MRIYRPHRDSAVRWILAAVFVYFASAKVLSATGGETIYGTMPAWVRTTLPLAELGLAVWLASGVLNRGAALAALVSLSLFSGVIAVELRKDQPKPCGCSGAVAGQDVASVRRSLYFSLGRNVLLMAAAGYLFLGNKKANLTVSGTQRLVTTAGEQHLPEGGKA